MTPLPGTARSHLLRLARTSIREALGGSGVLEAELSRSRPAGPLSEPRGAFVSLKLDEKLRGCVGRVESPRPLWSTVTEVARAAALDDPRFEPLRDRDLELVRIEISALTAPVAVATPDAIVIGRDGLRLELGRAYSVFLPQVAVEQGWNVERLLEQLAVKAGLEPGEWRTARLARFSAEVFSDGPRRGPERHGAAD